MTRILLGYRPAYLYFSDARNRFTNERKVVRTPEMAMRFTENLFGETRGYLTVCRLTTERRATAWIAVSVSGWNSSEGMAWGAAFPPAGNGVRAWLI
jgi:hypothetical protein